MHRQMPPFYTKYAFFSSGDGSGDDPAAMMYILGDGPAQAGPTFLPVIRYQEKAGFVTLQDGTTVFLGREIPLSVLDEAALAGMELAPTVHAQEGGIPTYTRVIASESFYTGPGRIRPKAVRPPRPEYIKDHQKFNITHCRVLAEPELVKMSMTTPRENFHARGGATVGFSIKAAEGQFYLGEGLKMYRIFFGVSLCSLMDGFDRKKGLDQAIGRIIKAEEGLAALKESGFSKTGLKYSPEWIMDQDFFGSALVCIANNNVIAENERGIRLKQATKMSLVGMILSSFDDLYFAIESGGYSYRGDHEEIRFYSMYDALWNVTEGFMKLILTPKEPAPEVVPTEMPKGTEALPPAEPFILSPLPNLHEGSTHGNFNITARPTEEPVTGFTPINEELPADMVRETADPEVQQVQTSAGVWPEVELVDDVVRSRQNQGQEPV